MKTTTKWLLYAASLKKVSFMKKLDEEGRRRRQRNLPRKSLLDPKDSPWAKVYESGDDSALITVTGFDHATFQFMLALLEPLFLQYTPWTGSQDGLKYKRIKYAKGRKRTGRKRKITCVSLLGLVLAWYRFRGSEFILQGWFGFTGSAINVWLRFGRRMLIKALSDLDICKVKYPTHQKMEELKRAVEDRHPALKDVYCVADGLKLGFHSCDELDEQSMYYNGWTHGHYITNLFVFTVDGRIVDSVYNVPGAMHGRRYGRSKGRRYGRS